MIFQEVMVYKNLIFRSIFATLLFIFYLISITNYNLIFILGSLIYLIIAFECFNFFKKYLLLIITYISLSFLCFYIYFFNFFDFYLFNILLFVIIVFDSFSYFTGLLFGKRPIFLSISPKKTLEGYIGGFFFTNFIVLSYLFIMHDSSQAKALMLLINSIILFAILGDLIQSFFKRKNNLKNSSTYLPGHGGFFDRFDSFIPTIVLLLFYSLY